MGVRGGVGLGENTRARRIRTRRRSQRRIRKKITTGRKTFSLGFCKFNHYLRASTGQQAPRVYACIPHVELQLMYTYNLWKFFFKPPRNLYIYPPSAGRRWFGFYFRCNARVGSNKKTNKIVKKTNKTTGKTIESEDYSLTRFSTDSAVSLFRDSEN